MACLTIVPTHPWYNQTKTGVEDSSCLWNLRQDKQLVGLALKTRGHMYLSCVLALCPGNVRSLANEPDELTALVSSQRENRESDVLYGDMAAPGHIWQQRLHMFGPTGITPRAVSLKHGDLQFSSTTAGVILVRLPSKNGSVAWTFNCWPLGSGHIIIDPGSFHTPLL